MLAIDWLTAPAPDGELNGLELIGPFGELNNFKVGIMNNWADTYTYRQIAIATLPENTPVTALVRFFMTPVADSWELNQITRITIHSSI